MVIAKQTPTRFTSSFFSFLFLLFEKKCLLLFLSVLFFSVDRLLQFIIWKWNPSHWNISIFHRIVLTKSFFLNKSTLKWHTIKKVYRNENKNNIQKRNERIEIEKKRKEKKWCRETNDDEPKKKESVRQKTKKKRIERFHTVISVRRENNLI